jgi:hypothetical protein
MPRHIAIPDEENTLLRNILEYCQLKHVLAHHGRPTPTGKEYVDANGHTKRRYVTPIAGNPGYFDLTILGPGGIIMAELKRRRGAKHTDEQKRWFDLAARAAAEFDRPGKPRFIVALWTFDNWPDEIYKAINSIAAPPPVHAVVVVNGPPSTIRDFGPDAPGMAMAREAREEQPPPAAAHPSPVRTALPR